MYTTIRSSSAQPKWALKQAREVEAKVAGIASEIQGLDNKPGVDTNPEPGKVEFAAHQFQSDSFSGNFSGEASLADGQLKDFALSAPGHERVVGFNNSNGKTYSWAPVEGGQMMVVSGPEEKTVSFEHFVDPKSPKERLKSTLADARDVAVAAVTTAIPFFGLGIHGMRNFFNDSNQGYQAVAMIGNVVGTGALFVAGLTAATPFVLGVAGVGLATAGLSAALQTAKETPGHSTEPYNLRTTWNYPTEK